MKADFELTLARAEVRDAHLFGEASKVRARYEERYIPGQRLYLSEVEPERHASVVVDNNDVLRPLIVPCSAVRHRTALPWPMRSEDAMRALIFAAFLFVVCLVSVAGWTPAQIPQKFTNLQVLPKDITRRSSSER